MSIGRSMTWSIIQYGSIAGHLVPTDRLDYEDGNLDRTFRKTEERGHRRGKKYLKDRGEAHDSRLHGERASDDPTV